METAAMLVMQDIGLAIDVGVGKGLDGVDVKATSRHLAATERKAGIKTAIATLEKSGVRFSRQLRDSVLSSATLRIQCKERTDIEAAGNVLVLEPANTGATESADRLSLDEVVSSRESLPRVRDWLQLLKHDLMT